MRLSNFSALLALAPLLAQTQLPTYRIAPLAGTYTVPNNTTSGDAYFSQPASVVADAGGSIYIADTENFFIRRLGTDFRVTVVAGTGVLASPQNAAGPQLGRVNALALYQGRLLYFGEQTRIRRLDLSSGRIDLVALTNVVSMTVDQSGTLYYVDGESVRAINPASGASRVVIAGLTNAGGITSDRPGNIFYTDNGPDGKARLRRILASDQSGVTTVASIDPLVSPRAMSISADGNVVFFADPASHRIARMDLVARILSIMAGDGTAGFSGENDRSRISGPSGVTVMPDASVVFADTQNLRIRRIALSAEVATLTGGWNSMGEQANAATALVGNPNAKVDRGTGGLLIAENNSCAIRGVTPGGVITTVAGRIGVCLAMPPRLTTLRDVTFNRPVAATRDAKGNLFVADSTGVWAILAQDRNARPVYAGTDVADLTLDAAGQWLYVVLTRQHLVVRISIPLIESGGEIDLEQVAGNTRAGFSGEGGLGFRAMLDRPTAVAIDGKGDLLIVDFGNSRLRRVTVANGAILTVAVVPGALTVAADKDYIYVGYSNRIARLDATGPTIIAGTNEFGLGVESGDPLQARFTDIAGMTTLADRSLIVSDYRNHRVRRIVVAIPDPPSTGGGTGGGGTGGGGTGGGGTGGGSTGGGASLGPPRITRVIGASSFGGLTAVAPGSWIEIYGENFATASRQWAAADFVNDAAPTTLGNVKVVVGDRLAFLQLVSPTQINGIIPDDLNVGNDFTIYVDVNGTRSPVATIRIDSRAPAFLAPSSFRQGDRQYAVAQFPDGVYAGPADLIPGAAFRPAKAGDRLVMFGVGFGQTTPRLPIGVIVKEATALPNVNLTLGGEKVTVDYAGLAGGFVGLYQFNIVVPATVPGDVALTGSIDGVPLRQGLALRVE